MTRKEAHRIALLLQCKLYDDVNANYSNNLEVLRYVLNTIEGGHLEDWLTDILLNDHWQEIEKFKSIRARMSEVSE